MPPTSASGCSSSGGGMGLWASPQARDFRSTTGKEVGQRENSGQNLNIQAVLWTMAWLGRSEFWEERVQAEGLLADTRRVMLRMTDGRYGPRRPATSELGRPPVPLDLHLSPRFSEWLMGWPDGWSESESSGMVSYLLWLRRHSAALREILRACDAKEE